MNQEKAHSITINLYGRLNHKEPVDILEELGKSSLADAYIHESNKGYNLTWKEDKIEYSITPVSIEHGFRNTVKKVRGKVKETRALVQSRSKNMFLAMLGLYKKEDFNLEETKELVSPIKTKQDYNQITSDYKFTYTITLKPISEETTQEDINNAAEDIKEKAGKSMLESIIEGLTSLNGMK